MTVKIGFIGAGNMAQAMIKGLISGGTPHETIMASSPTNRVHEVCGDGGYGIKTTNSNEELLAFADVVIIAIKPQLFGSVLPPLAQCFDRQLVLSVAAGVTIATIGKYIQYDNIVRCMPNTPALVQAGATGMFAGAAVSEADRRSAEALVVHTGMAVWVESEELIHAVTAVSGSAPAYFFYMLEAMITEGQRLGLTHDQSSALALQAAYGAAKMAKESGREPKLLREQVTSPNGTTHAAIESMRSNDFADVLGSAMQACVRRSKEMAAE